MHLIEIKKNTFDVILDLKYASEDNILGKKIFLEDRCFLLEEAAVKLLDAISIAKDLGYYFKIFDAYRPSYVQETLWCFDPNPNFLTVMLASSCDGFLHAPDRSFLPVCFSMLCLPSIRSPVPQIPGTDPE